MLCVKLTLCTSPSSSSISSHRHGLYEFLDIFEVFNSTFKLPTIDRLSSFAGVLEADAQVRASASSGFAVLNLLRSVADLEA